MRRLGRWGYCPRELTEKMVTAAIGIVDLLPSRNLFLRGAWEKKTSGIVCIV